MPFPSFSLSTGPLLREVAQGGLRVAMCGSLQDQRDIYIPPKRGRGWYPHPSRESGHPSRESGLEVGSMKRRRRVILSR